MPVPASKKRRLEGALDDSNPRDFAPRQEAVKVSSEPSGSSSDEASDVEDGSPEPPRKTPKQNHKHGSDLQGEAFSSGLYRSNIFKLQMDDLLAEVRPNYAKRMGLAEGALRKLKGIIEQIPEREPLSISEAGKELHKSHKISIPYPEPRPSSQAQYQLAYSKPANINVIGGYTLKTAIKSNGIISIDMVVIMPSALFQEKDYLNFRYFYKRAYYVACLAAGIREAKDCDFKLSYDRLGGNPLQPIIVVKPGKAGGADDFSSSNCEIHIIPAISENLFPIAKTLPERNCVRPSKDTTNEASTALAPTPFYNATLRSDSSVTLYLKLLHATSSSCESYRDACILGRIWLKQRGFGSPVSKGGFGHFEWAALMAILLQGGGPRGKSVLSLGYSSYQLFKATLQFLAGVDLTTKPVLFQADGVKIPKADGPTVFDGPRGLNILFRMPLWSYRLLQHEAKVALNMLNDNVFDQFESTFVLDANAPMLKHDVIVSLPFSTMPSPDTTASSIESSCDSRLRKIYQVLKKGLGDRVILVSLLPPPSKPWSTSTDVPSQEKDASLKIGFLLNPDNAGRTVDHGPPAEEKKEAAAFRRFWGEKAELRRFKDGSILESLVWSEKDSKHSIFRQIILYLLQRHVGLGASEAAVFGGDGFEAILSPRHGSADLSLASFQPLMTAFSTLELDLRKIEGLPLQLRQISAASPQLRYTAVQPPQITNNIMAMDPADVVLQFEGSGRWPDDLAAIQRTKIAFLLKISDLLEESVSGLTARVGLENTEYRILNASYLDVLYPTGAAFRIRIHNDREQTLLERRLKEKSLDPRSRDETAKALAAYKREFIQDPLHTQTLRSLCTRFPFLSPTIRLVKKWFNSHLLASHFPDALLELFVVRSFTHPYPWQPPSSLRTGFLRTIHFLSRWDWRADPLIIDFSSGSSSNSISPTDDDSMTSDDVKAIETRFEVWRKIDPAMNRVVLFAGSNLDRDGVTWTVDGRPSKVVATRMTALSRAVMASVSVGDAGANLDPKTLFISSPSSYDFVLHLNPRFVHPNSHHHTPSSTSNAHGAVFKNLQLASLSSPTSIEEIAYHPITALLSELDALYGNNILFFHNVLPSTIGAENGKGGMIAGLWSPGPTKPRPWKVGVTYNTMPVVVAGGDDDNDANDDDDDMADDDNDEDEDDGQGEEGVEGKRTAKEPQIVINKMAILHEIGRLAGDMVSRIEIHDS